MSSEETVRLNVQVTAEGIDQAIGKTKNLLYFMNAIRLSVRDIQMIFQQGPTVQNLMWTAIQLTRVYTHANRLLDAINKKQQVAIGTGLLRGAVGARGVGMGVRGLAAGQQTLFGGAVGGAGPGLLGAISALAMANPYLAGAVLAGVIISGLGYRQYFMDRKRRTETREWLQQQREIAKSQGYDN